MKNVFGGCPDMLGFRGAFRKLFGMVFGIFFGNRVLPPTTPKGDVRVEEHPGAQDYVGAREGT